MKKRMLAWLLVVAMMLGQVPVSAFAVEKETTPVTVTGEQSATEPAKAAEVKPTEPTKAGEKSTEPTKATEETGATEPSEGTGETREPTEETSEPTEETTAPAEETSEPTEAVDEAVAAVEGAIAALPALDALEALDEAAQNAAYEQAQSIADAYDALTEGQQGKVANFETLVAFLNWFAVPETLGISPTVQITYNGETTNLYGDPEDALKHNDCQDGATVTLCSNCTTSRKDAADFSRVTIDKSITLDLGNHKWDVSTFGLEVNGNVTIKNGTIDGQIYITANKTVTLDKVNTTLMAHNGTVTVKDSNCSVDWVPACNLTVESGTYSLTLHPKNSNGSNVTLKGGTFTSIVKDAQTGGSFRFENILASGYAYKQNNAFLKLADLTADKLENVTVTKCTHGDWEWGNGVTSCGYCGTKCEHPELPNENMTCSTCGNQFVIKLYVSLDASTFEDKWYKTTDIMGDLPGGGKVTMTIYSDLTYADVVYWGRYDLNLNGHTLTTSGNIVMSNILTVSNGTVNGPITTGTNYGGTDYVGHIYIKANTTVTGLVTFCAYESGKDVLEAGVTLQGGVKTTATDKHLSDYLAAGTAFTQGGNVVDATDKTELEGEVKVVSHTHNCNTTSGKCACGFECTQHTFDTLTGKCTTCRKDIAVAKVTSTTGGTAVTNYYQSFPKAYKAMADSGDTLTLLQDVSMSNADWNKQVGDSLDKSFTFDLNGHSCGIVNTETVAYQVNFGGTVTVKNGTIPYLLAMSDSQVELDGVASTQVTCNDGGKLEVKGNCNITRLICMDGGDLTVRGGKIGSLTVNESSKTYVALAGGSFTEITISNATIGYDMPSFLPDGYIYRKNTESDTSYLKKSELKEKSTLENVTVIECPHPSFAKPDEDGFAKCDYCDSCCVHISGVDTDGKCNTCKTQMEVAVTCTEEGSEITSYRPKLTVALAQISDESSNITVKLLKNVTLTENIAINKGLTIDLNGKTLDLGTGELIFSQTATLKSGTVKGNVTAKPNADVKDMKLTVESVTVENGKLWVDGVTKPVSVTVKDGSLNELYVESDGQNAQVKLYGGSYGKIPNDMMLIPAKSFLPEGYAYQKNGASLSLSELGNPLENVTVTQCTTHGAPASDGSCGYCGTKLEASVTVGETTTGYATFADALAVANSASGSTLKLLASVTTTSELKATGTFTLDLNGKTLSAYKLTLNGGSLTVKDSGTTGTIGGSILIQNSGTLQWTSGSAPHTAVALQGGQHHCQRW